jgi:hypothetical protein
MQLNNISIKRHNNLLPTVIITVNSDKGLARIELLDSKVAKFGLRKALANYIAIVKDNNRLSRQKLIFNMKAEIQDTSIMEATLAHLNR